MTPQAFMGSTRSSAMARSSRWRRNSWLLTPVTGDASAAVGRCPKVLTRKEPYDSEHQRTHQDDHGWRGRNGGQNHSLAKRIGERPRSINGSDQTINIASAAGVLMRYL